MIHSRCNGVAAPHRNREKLFAWWPDDFGNWHLCVTSLLRDPSLCFDSFIHYYDIFDNKTRTSPVLSSGNKRCPLSHTHTQSALLTFSLSWDNSTEEGSMWFLTSLWQRLNGNGDEKRNEIGGIFRTTMEVFISTRKVPPRPRTRMGCICISRMHGKEGRGGGRCSLCYATTHSRGMKQPIVHQCQFLEWWNQNDAGAGKGDSVYKTKWQRRKQNEEKNEAPSVSVKKPIGDKPPQVRETELRLGLRCNAILSSKRGVLPVEREGVVDIARLVPWCYMCRSQMPCQVWLSRCKLTLMLYAMSQCKNQWLTIRGRDSDLWIVFPGYSGRKP